MRVSRSQTAQPPLDLDALRLTVGAHVEGTGEMCVMEAAAYLAGEDWTDRPASVSPVIAELLAGFNDAMNDVDRQSLKPLIPMLPGTAGDEALEAKRSWLVMDWHCRVWPSVWLRAAGCFDEAAELEGSQDVTGPDAVRHALQPLRNAQAAAAERRLATTRAAPREALLSATAASGANENDPALIALRDAITSGDGWPGPAMWKALGELTASEQWSPACWDSWSEAWNSDGYRNAVAVEAGTVAAVRALFESSAWTAGWSTSRSAAADSWDMAHGRAKSIGRDAAVAVTIQAAWAATRTVDLPLAWPAAVEAADASVHASVRALQLAAVQLAIKLVDAGHPNAAR